MPNLAPTIIDRPRMAGARISDVGRRVPTSAAAVARGIDVPVDLPLNHRGRPIEWLSHSSLTKFACCPDDWRRHYLLGERAAPSGAMFLGGRVDDAFSHYYQCQMVGEELTLAQLKDAFHDIWQAKLADEDQERGVDWDDGLTEGVACRMGVQAIERSYHELRPRLGRAIGVQRHFELKLSDRVRWSITGYVDLDTVREQTVWVCEDPVDGDEFLVQDTGQEIPVVEVPTYWVAAGERPKPKRNQKPPEFLEVAVTRFATRRETREVYGVVDFKVKNDAIAGYKADGDAQATLYLAERWLAGRPAVDFRFAQVAKPGKRRQHIATALVTTTRTASQMRSILVRFAMVAAQINALYQQLGPDQPWGFAEPGSWKCQAHPQGRRGRFCSHWATCPAGKGL